MNRKHLQRRLTRRAARLHHLRCASRSRAGWLLSGHGCARRVLRAAWAGADPVTLAASHAWLVDEVVALRAAVAALWAVVGEGKV